VQAVEHGAVEIVSARVTVVAEPIGLSMTGGNSLVSCPTPQHNTVLHTLKITVKFEFVLKLYGWFSPSDYQAFLLSFLSRGADNLQKDNNSTFN